jgi:hypothetical protein
MDDRPLPTAVNPVGVTVLSDPAEAVIDVVFVHGLQGHPEKTWTWYSNKSVPPAPKSAKTDQRRTSKRFRFFSKGKSTASGGLSLEQTEDNVVDGGGGPLTTVFWPRDLLKVDFPNARIMTFGYNSIAAQGYQPVNQGNIFAHARDLLYKFEQKRRNTPNRGLVFIAHSLGGILVKEVLRRSEADPDLNINGIFKNTIGIFFFGTPHRGSKDWASYGEGIAAVASCMARMDVNDKIIKALLPSSAELELARESFAVQWMKRGDTLMVRTFQESKAISGLRVAGLNQLIVPPDSSTLDHPNQRARSIDADHMDMVKFYGRDDENYIMVKDDVQELITMASKRAETTIPGV